jgi:hypothetical protein
MGRRRREKLRGVNAAEQLDQRRWIDFGEHREGILNTKAAQENPF